MFLEYKIIEAKNDHQIKMLLLFINSFLNLS